MSLQGKTYFISGASRGIGKAIALRLAKESANIVIAAKSVEENAKLGGTIYSAAEEIKQAGGQALPVPCDIRDEAQIINAIQQAVNTFGGIDGVINNASAISLTDTAHTESKRYDLMYSINVRGTFLVTKHALPYLRKSSNPHILTLSPPIDMNPKWLSPSVAYTITKFNMSMMVIGWAEEFKSAGVAANALWPMTTIATAAVQNLLGGDFLTKRSRKPEIVADAAYYILTDSAKTCTGNLFLDEDVLRKHGITNFDNYAMVSGGELQRDLFI
jgi:citronellol/citronellal dehydrogenase